MMSQTATIPTIKMMLENASPLPVLPQAECHEEAVAMIEFRVKSA
jgi:hypothetical protein